MKKPNLLKLSALSVALTASMNTYAAQVFTTDLIIQGSACVGLDCVNGESFNFDTLRLKENNLRIKAQDTSASASFPTNDWQITFNDSGNGGQNKFSIDDIDGGRTPFTIEASAPSHSLYVNDGGRIGVGTSAPVVEMHIVNGDSPTLRLEQDGSSGFTPQKWDVAGNETNFFIRDATNGSPLPFRIRPSAPQNSFYIDTDGDIGMGTESPSANLHLLQTSTGVKQMLLLENNGGSYITFKNNNNAGSWYFTHENNAPNDFLISKNNSAAAMRLSESGDMTISGTLTTAGTACSGGCDLVFSDSYPLPSIEEHATEMWKNSFLPAVGQTIENSPFNITQKLGGMLNELEKAHIYIEQLHKRIEALETR
ncbi:hypothetical protein AN214_01378 [Pseudoalteromonas sp. P1-9]|uniref:hypothetical protein n=1 Tax=Pseudoalteromonas sp. P1-9 TaxID=1710354 RepID=UPI0006D5DBBD|nr:hypothetical protein [Pseudoalteromonas sp. P1-9]KPV96557.1 hypothetical protein AN214_01378 [Pseudoalteromonas sp. P1-9]